MGSCGSQSYLKSIFKRLKSTSTNGRWTHNAPEFLFFPGVFLQFNMITTIFGAATLFGLVCPINHFHHTAAIKPNPEIKRDVKLHRHEGVIILQLPSAGTLLNST